MARALLPWTGEKLLTRPFERLMDEMEDLMEHFREEGDGRLLGRFFPRANVAETEGQFEVTLDLPGVKPEEIKVELLQGNLIISGERKEEKEEKGKTFHRIERRCGAFRREIPLPAEIVEGKIDAKFKDGVLQIVLPKSEKSKAKQIAVKS
jgi:HSP20 family protein